MDRIPVNAGVCAWVQKQQIAIFRVSTVGDQVYAIGNDPFSKAHVLLRGIVGDRNGIPKVASPVYEQNFNLLTGECLDSPDTSVPTYALQVVDGQVQIGFQSRLVA